MFRSLLNRLPCLPVLRYRLARVARLVGVIARETVQNACSVVMTRTTDPAVRALFHGRPNPMSRCLRLTAPYWRLRSWADQPYLDAMEAGWEAHLEAQADPGYEAEVPPSRLGSLVEALREVVAPSRCRACGGPLWYADSFCPNERPPYGGPYVWEPAEGDDEDADLPASLFPPAA